MPLTTVRHSSGFWVQWSRVSGAISGGVVVWGGLDVVCFFDGLVSAGVWDDLGVLVMAAVVLMLMVVAVTGVVAAVVVVVVVVAGVVVLAAVVAGVVVLAAGVAIVKVVLVMVATVVEAVILAVVVVAVVAEVVAMDVLVVVSQLLQVLSHFPGTALHCECLNIV